MTNENMTAEEMRECIAKTAKEAWERLRKIEASYPTDSDFALPYSERWFALDALCCDLNIDY